MKHILFKVKNNKQDDWRSWCRFLCNHQHEAEETMLKENCLYERSVIYERDGEYYVVGTCAFNGNPKPTNLDIELNAKHKETKKECLGKAIALFKGEFQMPPTHEILYEFDLRK